MTFRLVYCVAIAIVFALSEATVPEDIKGTYVLSLADASHRGSCPSSIEHKGQVSKRENHPGLSLILHNTVSINNGTRCAAASDSSKYTSLMDSSTFESLIQKNPDLFPANAKDAKLRSLLLRARSIFGVEFVSSLDCGRHSFFNGTFSVFVRNETINAPELGLRDLNRGAKYLIMSEVGVAKPKRCVYRGVASSKGKKTVTTQGNVFACFPGSASVHLHDGTVTKAHNLGHGSKLRMAGTGKSSEVFGFSHRDENVIGEYIRFTAADGATLMISPSHYVFSNGILKLASALRKGDTLDRNVDKIKIVDVERKVHAVGRFNAHTISGEMIVDGFRVSCYTSAIHPSLAHTLLAPIRLLWSITGGWRESNSPLQFLHKDWGLHELANLLPSGPAAVQW